MRLFSALLILSGLTLMAQQPPASCPVTTPSYPRFVPPIPISAQQGAFYFGTDELWTQISSPVWTALPRWDAGYRQKIVWWTRGYRWRIDPSPALTVSGRKLDGSAPPLIFTGANGSYRDDMGSFIMSGVVVPAPGCWEITGRLNLTELKLVVWVGP
jgi:hypothetical protein